MIRSSLKAVVKHLLCLEYSTVAIGCDAIRDFLAGPEQLFDLLPSASPKVAATRSEFPDAVVLGSAFELPSPSGEATTEGSRTPAGLGKLVGMAAAEVNNLRPDDPRHHRVPQANYSPQEARWFRALLCDSLALHRQLDHEFPRLRQRYRAAAAELTGNARWARVCG